VPKFTKTDFSRLIPDPDQALVAMQNAAPEFTRCPRGHKLPHRVDAGICWADFCADTNENRVDAANDAVADLNKPMAAEMDLLPRGMENLALERQFSGVEDAARHKARSEEALRIANAYGIEQARNLIHSLPFIPKAPSDLDGDAYYDARLKQIGPYVLEKMIFLMMYGTPEEQKQYTFELAERFRSKKTEMVSAGIPAVQLIVKAEGGSKTAVFINPYDQQLNSQRGAVNNVQAQGSRPEAAALQQYDPQQLVREFIQQHHARHSSGSGQDPGAGGSDSQGGPSEVHDEPGRSEAEDQGSGDALPGIPPFWAQGR
jgi:hypothetical protein